MMPPLNHEECARLDDYVRQRGYTRTGLATRVFAAGRTRRRTVKSAQSLVNHWARLPSADDRRRPHLPDDVRQALEEMLGVPIAEIVGRSHRPGVDRNQPPDAGASVVPSVSLHRCSVFSRSH